MILKYKINLKIADQSEEQPIQKKVKNRWKVADLAAKNKHW